MQDLDPLDFRILAALQVNNMVSQRDIGDAIGLSAPAVQRRIKRLREIGAIIGDVSILNPDYLGSPITVIVQVEMETDNIEVVNNARIRFRETRQVQQCYYVTGQIDFLMVILVHSMKEYEVLTHELFFNDPAIRHFTTSVVMDNVKVSTSLPVPMRATGA